jgi:hypothetical protein
MAQRSTALPHGRDELAPPAEGFIDASARLTGFDAYELYGTGMSGLYHATVLDQVGREAINRFVEDLAAAGGDPGLISDETSTEIARAITHLWYLGVWPQLARPVHSALGRESANTAFIVSPQAYTEGLVWRTFHGHPAGAKAPGFGSWADPPPGAPSADRADPRGHGAEGYAR